MQPKLSKRHYKKLTDENEPGVFEFLFDQYLYVMKSLNKNWSTFWFRGLSLDGQKLKISLCSEDE